MNSFEYRLLTNTESDIQLFNRFYDALASNPDYIWSLDYMKKAIETNLPEVYVAIEILNGEMISALIGASLNSMYSSYVYGKFYNLVPFWVMGLWVAKKTVTHFPHERGDKLSTLLSDRFLSLGMDSFFVARKASNRVNYQNAVNYMTRFNRSEHYECSSIEKIFYSEGYESLRPSWNILYRMVCHRVCEDDKCVIVAKYTLKNEHRLTYPKELRTL